MDAAANKHGVKFQHLKMQTATHLSIHS